MLLANEPGGDASDGKVLGTLPHVSENRVFAGREALEEIFKFFGRSCGSHNMVPLVPGPCV
jgi:hypothetical protein